MTRFALNVERAKPKAREPDELPLAEQVIAVLKDRLPPDACCFAVARDAPCIVICHQGRPLGLHIKQERLTAVQICSFHRLRSAGMRIEMARSFNEAMKLIAEMGVTLRPAINSIYAARDFFREETRRK
ncbi:MAG TPA: hypothetical protein VH189_15900 [Rhizomicrobium sp.]|jgi:hypothetical protein|nr:hypothetical protein [Rhizomicrobium sp.]